MSHRSDVFFFFTADAAARFTQVPSNKLYVLKGETARFVWDYHVDNINEFDSSSPSWSFYDPNAKRIGYEYKFAGWKWTIDTNTCPLRLRSPTVRVSKQSTATLVITGVTTADNGTYGCTLVLVNPKPAVISKAQLIVTGMLVDSRQTNKICVELLNRHSRQTTTHCLDHDLMSYITVIFDSILLKRMISIEGRN